MLKPGQMNIKEAITFLRKCGMRVEHNIKEIKPNVFVRDGGFLTIKGDFRHSLKDDDDLIEFAEAVKKVWRD